MVSPANGNDKTLVVIGAGGRTGRPLVKQALARGYHVRAVEHTPSLAPAENLERMSADILEDDLSDVVAGADAVFSTIGLPLGPMAVMDPPPLYTEGMLRVTKAMKAARVSRLLVISAAFVEPDNGAPLWFRQSAGKALRHIFRQMADMERLLKASEGIDWTAVRPGWLLDQPMTTDYQVDADHLPRGAFRTRHGDLAHFMLETAFTEEWVHRTPFIARREPLRYASPPALFAELAEQGLSQLSRGN